MQEISRGTIFVRLISARRSLFMKILSGVGYFDSAGLCTEDYEAETKNGQKMLRSCWFDSFRRFLECVGGPRGVSVALAVQGKQLYVQLALFGVHSGRGPAPMKILTPVPFVPSCFISCGPRNCYARLAPRSSTPT